MQIQKITNYPLFKSNKNNHSQKNINIPKLSGQFAVGFLAATALTGILHKPKLHKASTLLTVASVITHIVSLRQPRHEHSIEG